jgi:hypothetical protein
MLPDTNFSMQEFIEYIVELEGKVKKANRYWSDNGKLIETRDKLMAENKKLRAANDALIDNIVCIKHRRNVLERKLNRVEYNMIKTIAIGLTEGEYHKLPEIEKHYWREYAELVLRCNK